MADAGFIGISRHRIGVDGVGVTFKGEQQRFDSKRGFLIFPGLVKIPIDSIKDLTSDVFAELEKENVPVGIRHYD